MTLSNFANAWNFRCPETPQHVFVVFLIRIVWEKLRNNLFSWSLKKAMQAKNLENAKVNAIACQHAMLLNTVQMCSKLNMIVDHIWKLIIILHPIYLKSEFCSMVKIFSMINFKNFSAQNTILRIFFGENEFLTSKRSELYGTTDFLANVGGLFGLFMGVSTLSVAELIYFCTFRLICQLRNRKH